MSSTALDPAKIASIQRQQDYQQKLDAYNRAEERRLQRKANFGKQALWGMLAFLLVGGFFYVVMPDMPIPAWIYIVPFFGGTELFLIVAYLMTLRPNTKPIAPTD